MADIARVESAQAGEEQDELASGAAGVAGIAVSGPTTARRRMRYRPAVKAVAKGDVPSALIEEGSRAERESSRIALWVSAGVVAALLAAMLLVLLGGNVNVSDVLSAFSVRFLSL